VSVEIRLLGGFEVSVDGRTVPASAWSRRQAAGLVKILALAPRRQLHREQVMDALWPDLPPDTAGPRLHKAAYFARRVLGPDSVLLRNDTVLLFPETPVEIDAARFLGLADRALADGGAVAAAEAAGLYAGPLLPEDRYEPWAEQERDRLALRHRQVLRLAGRWAALADLDPTDEQAQLAVMRELAGRGDHRGALRHYERLERARHRELGVGPGPEALELRDSLLASVVEQPAAAVASDLVGRDPELRRIGQVIAEAAAGRARTVFVSGPPGVGKSALLEAVRGDAGRRDWRTGHGAAAAVEGAWPYAPVLDALSDLCRRHPTLLDGLDDRFRGEIERALAGDDLDWSGDGGHQRLFVAVAELTRLAAAGTGAMLLIDDAHEADEASLRLLHYLARSCTRERLVLVVGHRRQPISDAFDEVRASMLGRLGAVDVAVPPLDRATSTALARRLRPDLDDTGADQIWEVSGGLPFAVVELVRAGELGAATPARPGAAVLGVLSPAIRSALEHVAVAGSTFDTDEFLALSGLAEPAAFDCLDAALAAMVVERTAGGFQFRHPLIREALLVELPPHRQRSLHRGCAERLIELAASPARIGHHLVLAGDPAAAVPYALRAAETAAAVGAYRDALRLVDSVVGHAVDRARARLYALRADLLAATGDPMAVPAYREAVEYADQAGRRVLRAKLGRLAVLSNDLATAEAVLDGLELDGGPDDATILLARGNLAYFRGDLAGAREASSGAYEMVAAGGDDWQVLDLLTLQGLLAHHQGEFVHRLQLDLQRTRHDPGLATAVFDAQLCVVEIMLYGPMPNDEVAAFATDLRATAQKVGALRAVAFAAALRGEALLLSGDLDAAERDLQEAADLHREIAAPAGEAHSLQRLAELHLHRGDRATANRLLQRALPLARWSLLALHLLQRIYGTMVNAAQDPAEAVEVVDRAEAARGTTDDCVFCDVTFALPAAIACARAGDVARAADYLGQAERSAKYWDGTVLQAMIMEARAHLALADGDKQEAGRLWTRAGQIFADAGQPLDARRCRSAVDAAA
jgi:DNA-binding SARP family transcriptional activator/tetratricopeptide (TPR) repeat protein